MRTDERTDYGDADTPLARWLRARIGTMKLREVQRRAARRGIKLSASLLSTYLKLGVFPTPDVARRLAMYFGVDVAEIEAMRPAGEAEGTGPAVTFATATAGGGVGTLPAEAERDAAALAWLTWVTARQISAEGRADLWDWVRAVNERVRERGTENDGGPGPEARGQVT